MRQLFDMLLSGRWLILACVFLAGLAGLAHALLATPIYRADALVQVEQEKGLLPGMERFAEGFADESNVAAEMELLRSRMILGRAVEDMNLEIVVRPRHFPVLGSFWRGGRLPGSCVRRC
ncbi:hypothetical protein CAI21_17130 [Alkalilimnicola ehrlichii]|uniref:Wzz/FepE/Etk N-terminal domain-containing protein n=1 Tax=Alkalilimnicola ehrlichii TaxID=351052 RepID=UPI000E2FE4F3|nr:Wzz/FepE/Etk N-terminal domain-containing protein [Alkalilimnicola ehrlichii]RFA26406.1 hypothetical protein CAI21_17130 [Alkalilimnicola ehrlichii]